MLGSELIVALFALVFLAFCLTAIALFAMSKNKDDIADRSVSNLRDLKLGNLEKAATKEDAKQNSESENGETSVSQNNDSQRN